MDALRQAIVCQFSFARVFLPRVVEGFVIFLDIERLDRLLGMREDIVGGLSVHRLGGCVVLHIRDGGRVVRGIRGRRIRRAFLRCPLRIR